MLTKLLDTSTLTILGMSDELTTLLMSISQEYCLLEIKLDDFNKEIQNLWLASSSGFMAYHFLILESFHAKGRKLNQHVWD